MPAPQDLTGSPIPAGFLAVTVLPPGMENSGYSATYFPPNSVLEVRFQSASVPRSKDAPVLLTMTQTERPDDPRDIGSAGATVSTVQLPFAERATLIVRGNDLQLHIRIPLVDVVIETSTDTRRAGRVGGDAGAAVVAGSSWTRYAVAHERYNRVGGARRACRDCGCTGRGCSCWWRWSMAGTSSSRRIAGRQLNA